MQLTQPKTSLRVSAPRRRATPVAASRSVAPATPLRSNAPALTLAAVIVVDLLLAVTTALAGALGA